MKKFFIFFLGGIFLTSQAFCTPPSDYGEGWKWHTTLKATYKGKEFDFEPVHAEMWKNQRVVSQITDGSNVNVVFVRFSILYQAANGIESEIIKLTSPIGGKEIVFFSGWDEEIKNLQEPTPKSLGPARLLNFQAQLPYVGCQRYCVNWERETQTFADRFSSQNLQNLKLHDPGDYAKDGAAFSRDEDYRLCNLSKRAEEMALELKNTLPSVNDVKKLTDLITQCRSGGNIINGNSGKLFQDMIRTAQSIKTKDKKSLIERKKKLHICAETLALDILRNAFVFDDGQQPLLDNMEDVGRQFRRELDKSRSKNPLFLIAHFHSEMDPCHICSPTFLVETRTGILAQLSAYMHIPLATFVSSAEQYKARLYRPLPFAWDHFPEDALYETSANLETLDHVVQCRFKTQDWVIFQANPDESEKFISTYARDKLKLTTQPFGMNYFLTTSVDVLKSGLAQVTPANRLFLLKDTQEVNLTNPELKDRLTALKPSKAFFVSSAPLTYGQVPVISLQNFTTISENLAGANSRPEYDAYEKELEAEEQRLYSTLDSLFDPTIDQEASHQFFERFKPASGAGAAVH